MTSMPVRTKGAGPTLKKAKVGTLPLYIPLLNMILIINFKAKTGTSSRGKLRSVRRTCFLKLQVPTKCPNSTADKKRTETVGRSKDDDSDDSDRPKKKAPAKSKSQAKPNGKGKR